MLTTCSLVSSELVGITQNVDYSQYKQLCMRRKYTPENTTNGSIKIILVLKYKSLHKRVDNTPKSYFIIRFSIYTLM